MSLGHFISAFSMPILFNVFSTATPVARVINGIFEWVTFGFNIIDNVGAVKPADRRAELRKISHSLLLPFSDFFTVYHEKRRKTTENVAARAQVRRFHDLFTDAGAASDDVYSSIRRVPATTRVRPRAAFFVSFSWNTSHENRIVTRMLSLSMGATTLAGPSCRAL